MYMQFSFHVNIKFIGDTGNLYHTNILSHPGPGLTGIVKTNL